MSKFFKTGAILDIITGVPGSGKTELAKTTKKRNLIHTDKYYRNTLTWRSFSSRLLRALEKYSDQSHVIVEGFGLYNPKVLKRLSQRHTLGSVKILDPNPEWLAKRRRSYDLTNAKVRFLRSRWWLDDKFMGMGETRRRNKMNQFLQEYNL